MPRDPPKRKKEGRHNPLEVDLAADRAGGVRLKRPLKDTRKEDDSDEDDVKFLPEDLSKKVLHTVRRQQKELQLEQERQVVKETAKEVKKVNKRMGNRFEAIMDEGGDQEEEELEESDIEEEEEAVDVDIEDVDIDELRGQLAMDPNDEKLFASFVGAKKSRNGGGMNGNFEEEEEKNKTLNDVILSKIMEHERLQAEGAVEKKTTTAEEAFQKVRSTLNPKVVEAYSLIAKLLRHYTSGKLPKAFNIIPALTNWEEILYLTRPDEWSAQAVRAATRVFASNLNRNMVAHYCNLVLFPRIRDDIDKNKKLNWHLYMALKKSLWKPDAFYKGILLPLCESSDCTFREAAILASLIKRVSIPSAHSAVALYKIAGMPYSGPNTLFIGVLLNKKYALPYEVLDSVVEHFLRVNEDDATPPVLWHQALLVLAQRYKNELTHAQKESLKSLIRRHSHALITPEIRRELVASRNREDDPNVEVLSTETEAPASRRHRKPKGGVSMKPSFALPGQVPEDEDGDDDDNAMDE